MPGYLNRQRKPDPPLGIQQPLKGIRISSISIRGAGRQLPRITGSGIFTWVVMKSTPLSPPIEDFLKKAPSDSDLVTLGI